MSAKQLCGRVYAALTSGPTPIRTLTGRRALDAPEGDLAARDVLAELVALKDGPRDEMYAIRKPHVWSRAREVLSAPSVAAPPREDEDAEPLASDIERMQTWMDALPDELESAALRSVLAAARRWNEQSIDEADEASADDLRWAVERLHNLASGDEFQDEDEVAVRFVEGWHRDHSRAAALDGPMRSAKPEPVDEAPEVIGYLVHRSDRMPPPLTGYAIANVYPTRELAVAARDGEDVIRRMGCQVYRVVNDEPVKGEQ